MRKRKFLLVESSSPASVGNMSKCHRLYGAFQNNELQSSEKLVFSLIASYISALLYIFKANFYILKANYSASKKHFAESYCKSHGKILARL